VKLLQLKETLLISLVLVVITLLLQARNTAMSRNSLNQHVVVIRMQLELQDLSLLMEHLEELPLLH
jgi:hypothetical protein